MATRVSPTLIGAFVLGGIALLVSAALVLGGRDWFKRPVTCVMGFDGSVAGLTVGAPVSFRGVEIGKVARIELRPQSPVIAVLTHIDPSQARGFPMPLASADTERIIREAVQNGLRAQLQIQSLVTAQLYVELDFYPGTPARRMGGVDDERCEIPTVPTAIAELQQHVKKILAQLDHAPVDELVASAVRTLGAVEKLATDPDVARLPATLGGAARDARVLINNLNAKVDPTVTSLQQVLAQAQRTIDDVGRDVRRLVQNLDARTGSLTADVSATTESARALLQDARHTLHDVDERIGPAMVAFSDALEATRDAMREMKSATGQVNGVVDGSSPLGARLAEALEQLTRTARAVRALSDDIRREPNSVLFGRSKTTEE